MTELDDIDGLASEYVLGTLDAAERAMVAARRQREPALEAEILDWEKRLAGLNVDVLPVAPPDAVWQGIQQRLTAAHAPLQPSANSAQVVTLERRVTMWRRTAMAASALAASLLLAIGVREFAFPPKEATFVGVFQKDDVSPAFMLSIDIVERRITIRQVAAPSEPGKTYQLWIASDRIGPAPQSLGLIEAREVTKTLPFETALLRQATFGISLEDAGGSRTGRPAANALHTKLFEATP
jgi:anti-sigma-K factor RskA